jgi:hypothetical protein
MRSGCRTDRERLLDRLDVKQQQRHRPARFTDVRLGSGEQPGGGRLGTGQQRRRDRRPEVHQRD